jgi:gas vesicle protein
VITALFPHLAANVSPTAAATETAQPTTSSAGGISGFEAAVIGAVGSVIGGIVGGWFALLATTRQSRRERAEKRRERSRQAAMNIASAWPILEEVLLARAADDALASDLDRAYNTFATIATTQSLAIIDAEVRRLIREQVHLVFPLTNHNTERATLAAEMESLRSHGDAMREAIAAHYNDEPLPAHIGLPGRYT